MEKSNLYSSCCVAQHSCKCFDILTDEERDLLMANSVLIKYKKNEVICKQGSMVPQIMFLEQGLVKVYLENDINILVLAIIPERNFFGLTAISDEQNKNQYSVMTYTASIVRQIDFTVFRKLVMQNSLFAKEIIEILIANNTQIYNRFFCLTHKQAYGRIADIILCLSNRVFKSPVFELPLSRKDFAELSGLSTETVIRLLKRFSDENIISFEARVFKVLDITRLQSISDKG